MKNADRMVVAMVLTTVGICMAMIFLVMLTSDRTRTVEWNNSLENMDTPTKFSMLYTEAIRSDQEVVVLAERLLEERDSEEIRAMYVAAQDHCMAVVASYNSLAKDADPKDLETAFLPTKIDDSNERFDCRE